MDKEDVINQLQQYIDVLSNEDVRLDSVLTNHTPSYETFYGDGKVIASDKVGDNFSIDIDVSYLDRV